MCSFVRFVKFGRFDRLKLPLAGALHVTEATYRRGAKAFDWSGDEGRLCKASTQVQ
jgi:hypothetical protein